MLSPSGPRSVGKSDSDNPAVVDDVDDVDVDDVDTATADGCWTAWDTDDADTSWLAVDAVVCAEVPAGVLAAWVTAADCPASPAGLVVWGGASNGVICTAAADAPAYPYIAAASWAHIST